MAESVEEIFEKTGTRLSGHFLLASGLHSPVYWEKFRILQFPRYTEKLCGMIARRFKGEGVEVVAGPTTGGIILAHEVARQLGVRSIFAEKQGDIRIFGRGLRLEPGEKVLVVDDVLTTGGSVQEVLAAVSKASGKVIGIGVLVDRSDKQVDFGVPLFSCYRAVTPAYKPESCPLCATGVPLTEPGASHKTAG